MAAEGIRAREVHHGYAGLPVLDGVDLQVEAGGRLAVGSTPGEGTRVTLEVPVA